MAKTSASMQAKSAKSKKPPGPSIKVIADHRKARHLYRVLSTKEAGVVLLGHEVKSLRLSGANLTGSYAKLTEANEVVVINIHIKAYQSGPTVLHESKRVRKLLLKKKEIRKLKGELSVAGQTLVPLELYLKDNLVKIKLGLCVGKKEYDKRATLKERDAKRKVENYMKTRYLRS